jgi:O-acetyl-ADP-ribose deacetylase (regulator of RNase III)
MSNKETSIKYIQHDITDPIETQNIILIVHVVNDIGVMGAGVAKALFIKWPNVRKDYLEWYNFKTIEPSSGQTIRPFGIGKCQLVEVAPPNIYVINMVGQNGIRIVGDSIPLNYRELVSCLKEVERLATQMNEHFKRDVEIHMPRIGCGLAGGKWEIVQEIILQTIKHPVTVYDWE